MPRKKKIPEEEIKPTFKDKFKSTIKKPIVIVFILIILLLSATTIYFYKKSIKATSTPNQSEMNEDKMEEIIKRMKDIMVLPEEEVPSIAMVTDPALLSAQSFFSASKKGDIVLIYSNIKKAVLFDPELNKIKDIAPLNINATDPSTQISP